MLVLLVQSTKAVLLEISGSFLTVAEDFTMPILDI